MRNFFKIFFASLLALIVFGVISIIVMLAMIGKALAPEKVVIDPNSVLVLETSQPYGEQKTNNPIGALLQRDASETPGLYDAVRMIEHAAKDDNIKGIYLKTDGNPNGFATSEELRNALLQFRKSGKFVYAYGEGMSQQAYYLASTANKIFLHPQGGVDFQGFSTTIMFLKGTLEKLEIQPQIFYDGRFKSATEPFRETQMTEANRIQTRAYLSDLYGHYLANIGKSRNLDTATLYRYANEGLIQNAHDAVNLKLVDGLRYDDQVMDELRKQLNLEKGDDINFVSLTKYESGADYKSTSGDSKIAVLYAQGSIVSKSGNEDVIIASEDYIKEIRKLREDKSIKAIVFRVNSPGGSALASESIWRELELAKKAKPVVVSMGDYAASGGYYISCMADTIFAQPNTLTGSIGVFAMMANLQNFFKNKLGVTFDGVKTAQYADLGSATRPMTETERQFIQKAIDSIYSTFKSRVIAGRKLQAAVVDSIAQGRVWSGVQAKQLGLVDRIGGLNEAVACAAKMAKVSSYRLREYPEVKEPLEKLMKTFGSDASASYVKKELGANYSIYQQIKRLQEMEGEIQARLPFDLLIK
ncbi:signal peptide peptidase SppA [Chitinophaga agrisoli]|uniref:Signal peptide peptidase SppA n=1 Tax=Chitinophaga agrisoli TaxID=2607653 RepID=A0A5B2VVU5_9BACT|nr:signal peptide peptidase SppA [Chitinophaga agrisoli]KAA2243411.1 signal peptide peptidase SppA [Chitinophaga agrisoli]